jgi:proteasome lid subunit RPN8/RPN11
VPNPTYVRIPKAVYEFIARWAEKAYPHEGCGLLIGRFAKDGGKEVVRLAELTNLAKRVEPGAQQDVRFSTLPAERREHGGGTEFVMSPDDFNRETLKAEKEGFDVVGVIHTHPDHPPRPSAIDASQPFLAQWSNIIVAVDKGRTREMKSWFRETDDLPFTEESLRID